MTYRECAIVEAYTGVCTLPKGKRHYYFEYLAELFNCDLPTIYKMYCESLQYPEIKRASQSDFIKLCETATE